MCTPSTRSATDVELWKLSPVPSRTSSGYLHCNTVLICNDQSESTSAFLLNMQIVQRGNNFSTMRYNAIKPWLCHAHSSGTEEFPGLHLPICSLGVVGHKSPKLECLAYRYMEWAGVEPVWDQHLCQVANAVLHGIDNLFHWYTVPANQILVQFIFNSV